MTDLEHRLTEALRAGADDAPDAIGLAGRARSRARTRRRHRYAAAGVAAALVVAVPAGAVALHRSGGPQPAQGPSTAPVGPVGTPAAAGYRWESWHGVSVQVPNTWDYGRLTSWCGGGASPTPRVARPEDPDFQMSCTPSETYGLAFSVAPGPGLDWPVAEQGNDGFPARTYVGTRDVDGVFVEVGTASYALSVRILSTVAPTDAVLPDGCPATSSGPGVPLPSGAVAICGYDHGGGLSRSRLLTGAAASPLAARLTSTTARGPGPCASTGAPPASVRVWLHGTAHALSWSLGACWLSSPGAG